MYRSVIVLDSKSKINEKHKNLRTWAQIPPHLVCKKENNKRTLNGVRGNERVEGDRGDEKGMLWNLNFKPIVFGAGCGCGFGSGIGLIGRSTLNCNIKPRRCNRFDVDNFFFHFSSVQSI